MGDGLELGRRVFPSQSFILGDEMFKVKRRGGYPWVAGGETQGEGQAVLIDRGRQSLGKSKGWESSSRRVSFKAWCLIQRMMSLILIVWFNVSFHMID